MPYAHPWATGKDSANKGRKGKRHAAKTTHNKRQAGSGGQKL